MSAVHCAIGLAGVFAVIVLLWTLCRLARDIRSDLE